MKKFILFLALVVALFVIVLIINLVRGKSTLPPPSQILEDQTPDINKIIYELAPETTLDGKENGEPNKSKISGALREFIVNGKNFSFTPNTITVKKDDKVRIVFKNSQGFHDFKIDAYGIATKQFNAPLEEVLEFTADKVGTFEYYCSVGSHRAMGMVGTLKVE